MQQDKEFYFWIKGDIYPFDKNYYFKTSEFSCKCDYPECKQQKVSKDLITRLLALREDIKEPITVTSGYRCSKYQEQIAKEGISTVVATKSQHELGNAADVKPIRMKIEFFLSMAAKHFEAIGIASTWLHLDTRTGKDRRWNY